MHAVASRVWFSGGVLTKNKEQTGKHYRADKHTTLALHGNNGLVCFEW